MSEVVRLMRDFEQVDSSKLPDVYWLVAHAIEQTLIDSGAVAGVDYGYLDLLRLAQPHVLAECEKGGVDIETWCLKK